MAITGRFEADFEPFYQATRKAVSELQKLEMAGGKAAQSVDVVSKSFKTEQLERYMASLRNLEKVRASELATTTTRIEGMNQALGQMSRVAGAAGVSLGPLPALISSVALAIQAAQLALGPFAVILAVIATAIAAWQFGRHISELADLDTKVANLTARLLGLKTAADAAGGVDAVTLANREDEARKKIEANQKASEANAKATADATKQAALDEKNWQTLMKAGVDADAKRTKQAIEDEKTWADILAKRAADAKKADADAMAARAAQAVMAIEAGRAQQEADLAQMQAQARLRAEVQATTVALEAQRWAALKALNASLAVTQTYDLSTAAGRAAFLKANPGGSIGADAEYFKTHTLAEGVAAGKVSFTGGGGVDVGMGATAKGTAKAGGGGTVSVAPVTVNVSGVFDPASQKAITGAVSKGIYEVLKTSRKPTSYGGGHG